MQAMGFQRPSSYKQKQQSVPKTAKEVEDQGDSFINTRIPYLSPTTNEPIAFDSYYNSWVAEHPSALGSFDRMMKASKGKTIAVFLDYDGTLSHIVDDPDRAFMSDEMRGAVREVAKLFPTAIISGRSREKVKDFVKLSNVYYAGSHGMDIMAPARPRKYNDGKHQTVALDKKESEVLFQPAKKFLPAIQEIFTILEEKTKKIQGARVEDNSFCISVHFRQVRKEDYGMLEEKVKSVVENYPEFHLTEGKMVLEVRPSIDWNKGHALEYLLDTLGFSSSAGDVLPLYIGDDRTDEDAFKVIRSRGGQGYPIIVSSAPKDTSASYSLRDPSEVLAFLLRLGKSRKASSSSRSLARFGGFR
ncbi:probable trehalose-phosphate phosphatase C isoform X1 [Alnus glutinosa]|uniref:probable trehalose-phosphate phosphatase C isoform X1 n=2 Tax=Alnus glutinosa TaxID=3517 RepID=UPI002D793894|nr:probable trehalose-phosphate phosphatase C isoform X1 [Alnus glutinosa]